MLQNWGCYLFISFSVLFLGLRLKQKKMQSRHLNILLLKTYLFWQFWSGEQNSVDFQLETSFHTSTRGKITTPNVDDFAGKKHFWI